MTHGFRSIAFVLALAAALVCISPPAAEAQTILTRTTLSAAITDTGARVLVVGSATGISGPTIPTVQASNLGTQLYIDRELVDVTAVNGTTITVRRGAGGTKAALHASGALVFIGTPAQFFSAPLTAAGGDPMGACTRTNLPYPDITQVLPFINVSSGNISDCLGGQWVTGFRSPFTKFQTSFPEPGAVAYTSINTNGTTLSATTMYCTEVNLPYNKLLTGIAILNGTTIGTDNHLVGLYDAGGTLLANSAVAGALAASASTYQKFNFLTSFYAVGPAQYFACMQTNGTTATVRMAVTGIQDNLLTKGQTGVTFGTLPALTVPTTFTTAVGPYVFLF